MRHHPLANCEECTLFAQKGHVPTSAPQSARYVFVGIAPSYQEVKLGTPMVGPSGKLLDAVLRFYDIDRERDCAITNTVSCQTPENREPTKAEIACCAERLKSEIDTIHPEVIITLGNIATAAIMGHPVKITQFRPGPAKDCERYPYSKVVATTHPAACLRSADAFPSLVADLGKIRDPSRPPFEPPKYVVY